MTAAAAAESGCRERAETLALHAGGDLDQAEAAELRAHLEVCAGCRAALASQREALEWMRGNAPPVPDERLLGELRARVDQAVGGTRPHPWLLAWWGRLREPGGMTSATRGGFLLARLVPAVATALLLVGSAGVLLQSRQRPSGGAAAAVEAANTAYRPGTAPVVRSAEEDLERFVAEEIGGSAARAEGEVAVEGSDGADGSEGTDPADQASAPQAMRIEMQTRDPEVRIIWFADNQPREPRGR